MVRHVAMYLRISQEKRNENVDTLANHRNILTEFAAKNGFTFEEFSEVLSGGKSELDDRPQLQCLLDNIEKFDAILVMELSRISRNGLISETVLQYCVDYDKPIITPEKKYDLANDQSDVLMFRFGSLIASQEHGVIGKRSKNNKISMAKLGLHIAGSVPYGYKRDAATKKLVIYEPQARVVRYIFRLHDEGLGSRKIVDRLNREGYKPLRSDAFQLPTVKRIIQNPVYKGTVVFQDRKRIKEHGKYTYKVLDTIITENAHPPIVSAEEWAKANRDRIYRAKMARTVREKPSIKTGVTMLKDLLFCGACGRKMAIKKEPYGTYSLKPCEFQLANSAEKCINCGIKISVLEKHIYLTLQNRSKQLAEELKLLEQNDTTDIENDINERLSRTGVRIEDNRKQQSKLLELALSGIFSNEELKDKKQELINMQQSLVAEKESLLQQAESIDVVSHVEKITQIINMLKAFDSLLPEEQNETLKQFIKKIHYTRLIPEDIRKLTTRNSLRRNYPFSIDIEYF